MSEQSRNPAEDDVEVACQVFDRLVARGREAARELQRAEDLGGLAGGERAPSLLPEEAVQEEGELPPAELASLFATGCVVRFGKLPASDRPTFLRGLARDLAPLQGAVQRNLLAALTPPAARASSEGTGVGSTASSSWPACRPTWRTGSSRAAAC